MHCFFFKYLTANVFKAEKIDSNDIQDPYIEFNLTCAKIIHTFLLLPHWSASFASSVGPHRVQRRRVWTCRLCERSETSESSGKMLLQMPRHETQNIKRVPTAAMYSAGLTNSFLFVLQTQGSRACTRGSCIALMSSGRWTSAPAVCVCLEMYTVGVNAALCSPVQPSVLQNTPLCQKCSHHGSSTGTGISSVYVLSS